MSGQDILDQAAGTTAFVQDYLHIDWDGTRGPERQGDRRRHGVAGNPVTDGIGTVPLDHSVLGADVRGPDHARSRRRSRRSPTTRSQPDALTFAADGYKVAFLAFPLEAYGTAAQKADLMTRTLDWFGTP